MPELSIKQTVLCDMPVIESCKGKYVKIKNIKKDVLNLASFDFLCLSGRDEVKNETIRCLEYYGVGSCGPRGFYGTIDQHLRIESAIAKFCGVQEAIAYSEGASAVTSAISAFAKKGDLLLVDEACGLPILNGVDLSRSTVYYFKHNDMVDLESILKTIADDDRKLKRNSLDQRRFIIAEGLYRNTGQLCELSKIIELKEKYFYRLILDESLSFGAIGKTGRGVLEHFNVPASEVEIRIVSMDSTLASCGGICVGTREIVDHQRLSGAGYCFSASSPPFFSGTAAVALEIMEKNPGLLAKLHSNAKKLGTSLEKIKGWKLYSKEKNPILHLVLHPAPNRLEEEEDKILRIVQTCLELGVGVVASKQALTKSSKNLRPSIRVCISSELSDKEINTAYETIEKAVTMVI